MDLKHISQFPNLSQSYIKLTPTSTVEPGGNGQDRSPVHVIVLTQLIFWTPLECYPIPQIKLLICSSHFVTLSQTAKNVHISGFISSFFPPIGEI